MCCATPGMKMSVINYEFTRPEGVSRLSGAPFYEITPVFLVSSQL